MAIIATNAGAVLVDDDDDAPATSAVAQNEAFIRAMSRAIRKGREKVRPGVHRDDTPHYPRTIHAEPRYSGFGSPGAMCADNGNPNGGAETLK